MAPEENTAAGDRRRRVLVFPLPYQGHMSPMFHLAGLLHARGFAVTVFHTDSNAPDPSSHPEYDFVAVPDGMPAAKQDVVKVIEHVLALNRSCEEPFRERLAALLEARDDVACLVADAHLLTLMDVARKQGVPTLALRTGSAACFRNIMANPMLCDKGYLPAQESQLDLPVKELPPYRVRDLMTIGRSRDEHDLSCKLLSRAVEAVRASSGFILNTFDALESDVLATTRQDLALPVFDIGPLHKISPAASSSLLLQDRACLEWLDVQAPASVLYISFGSIAQLPAKQVEELARGLEASGRPFVWAIKEAKADAAVRALLDDEGFEERVKDRGLLVRGWAPQVTILSHPAVGGFLTHCGWNATLEAISHGVPALTWPNFADQFSSERLLVDVLRVGVRSGVKLPAMSSTGVDVGVQVTSEDVEKVVAELMDDGTEGAARRSRSKELAAEARAAMEEGGSSYTDLGDMIRYVSELSRTRSHERKASSTSLPSMATDLGSKNGHEKVEADAALSVHS